ncbi:Holliday junction branch migration protein RuvA [Lacticaseibacillus brantae]|uniref:Holliday junction branch migration complex subunit RuvA n=1 Tax=Lacticaseibacillus brantae DSM 23927 TaxID=1423727 RepID=A0A0R2B507_9LACO|nr:Holliday junction branch migration protein RuvA [Lacticaseibacillus brantae]KRM71531.1 holliday junction atp-dependent dna helicase ruva [Lacticaseibacillus brantae DSM 23927]
MYEYFKGTVAAITPAYVVLDVSGIGYRLLVANPYHYSEGQTTTIYVQQIIRDNDQSLYGFIDAEQKGLFNQLLSVTGIGPKSALAILANGDKTTLTEAIASENVTFLTKFPGIGKKTAAQIVLDLKGKLQAAPIETPTSSASPALDDALAALLALGYSEKEIARVQKALAQEPAMATDAYLRTGLKMLTIGR